MKTLNYIPLIALWFRNRHFRIVFNSKLIDPKFYCLLNPEITQTLTKSNLYNRYLVAKHWVDRGWKIGRSPTHWFRVNWYRSKYLIAEEDDPFCHFIEKGWLENKNPNQIFFTEYFKNNAIKNAGQRRQKIQKRLSKSVWIRSWVGGAKPNPLFDTSYYIDSNPEVFEKWGEPLSHYLNEGFGKIFDPDALFDIDYYKDSNPSAAKLKIPELYHYIVYGAAEGSSPNRLFDVEYYKTKHKLDKLEEWEVFAHFCDIGFKAGDRPSAYFDLKYYAKRYPEYAITHSNPIAHYTDVGVHEGYFPCKEISLLSVFPQYSILMPVYNTPKGLLKKAIDSVLYQAYPNWELCIVDDGSTVLEDEGYLEQLIEKDSRILFKRSSANNGIASATRKSLKMARGEYIGFLDHDDELVTRALFCVSKIIEYTGQFDILYSDEDLISEEGRLLETRFKPKYNEELLLSYNYINHFLVVRKELFAKIDPFKEKYSGAQDYDLLLRLVEITSNIEHLADSLYKWRLIESSISKNSENKSYAAVAGLTAVRSAVERRNISASVNHGNSNFFYETRRVSKRNARVAKIFLNSCEEENYIDNLEIALHSGDSVEGPIFIVGLPDMINIAKSEFRNVSDRLIYIECIEKYREAQIVNNIAESIEGVEYLLISGDEHLPNKNNWIENLIAYGQYSDIGLVGGRTASLERLLNWKKTDLQNIALKKYAKDYKDIFTNGSRIFNNVHFPQDVMAISMEQMLIRRSLFLEIGGFDTLEFPGLFYDLDFSLRVKRAGYRNIFTPYSGATRSQRKGAGNETWYQLEKKKFKIKWGDYLQAGDPYLNEGFVTRGGSTTGDEWIEWYAK